MRIIPAGHIEGLMGGSGRLVFHTRANGQVFARSRGNKSRDNALPTSQQQVVRAFLANASRDWKNLTAEQREDWVKYGRKHFSRGRRGYKVSTIGVAVYARLGVMRQIMGLPLVHDAPAEPPPGTMPRIEQLPAPDANTIRLRITHRYPDPGAYRVLVRMTPATASVACVPLESAYRFVRGANPESAPPLPPSGDTLTLGSTCFAVQNGERYGVEVRIVRIADGIASPPARADFIKAAEAE